MKMYRTRDTLASARRAYEQYTHVVLNRCFRIGKPAIVRFSEITDLPLFMHLPWQNGTNSQVRRWRSEGGIMVDGSPDSQGIGTRDVTVLAECPTNMARLKACAGKSEHAVVVNVPVSWRTHEDAIGRHCAPPEALRRMRDTIKSMPAPPDAERIAAASRFPASPYVCADSDIGAELDMPAETIRCMRKSLNAQEVWCVKLRLAPEAPTHRKAWDVLSGMPGSTEKIFHTLSGTVYGWKRAVKDMARLGNIGLRKFYVYAPFEPDYDKLGKAHRSAQADLNRVRELVISLPDYLGGE